MDHVADVLGHTITAACAEPAALAAGEAGGRALAQHARGAAAALVARGAGAGAGADAVRAELAPRAAGCSPPPRRRRSGHPGAASARVAPDLCTCQGEAAALPAGLPRSLGGSAPGAVAGLPGASSDLYSYYRHQGN